MATRNPFVNKEPVRWSPDCYEICSKEGNRLPVVKITGQGIVAIALSVVLLWGCWIATRIITDRSLAERARVLHDLQLLQQKRQAHPQPDVVPAAGRQRSPSLLT